MLHTSNLGRHQTTGADFRAVKANNILNKEIFNLCEDCAVNKMASIPPSAFSAKRIRETQRDMKLSNIKPSSGNSKDFTNPAVELTLVKYNSKLMNSIWGFYNRYSPHNVKKVNEAIAFTNDIRQ